MTSNRDIVTDAFCLADDEPGARRDGPAMREHGRDRFQAGNLPGQASRPGDLLVYRGPVEGVGRRQALAIVDACHGSTRRPTSTPRLFRG